MNCSLPGSSIHGIFQARVLEWGAIAFSILDARLHYIKTTKDVPGDPVVKNPPANVGDTDAIPGLGRSHMPQSN